MIHKHRKSKIRKFKTSLKLIFLAFQLIHKNYKNNSINSKAHLRRLKFNKILIINNNYNKI